jgi:TctA family transporter
MVAPKQPDGLSKLLKGRTVDKSDRIPAVFFVLLSLFACLQAVGIGLGSFRHPGPGFLPFSAGALIGVLALWCLIQSMIVSDGDFMIFVNRPISAFFMLMALGLIVLGFTKKRTFTTNQ